MGGEYRPSPTPPITSSGSVWVRGGMPCPKYVKLQLMRRFQKDNMHLHLHHEAKQWPYADHFLDALPVPPWRGKNLTCTFNKNAKYPFVFVVSPYPFTSSATDEEDWLLFDAFCCSAQHSKA